MADTKITDLVELTAIADDDWLVTVDKSDTSMASSGTTKKITRANALGSDGTWTPTLVGSSTAGTHTYTTQVGTFTRVGRLVFIQFFVDISSVDGAMAGDCRISGLPFTSLATPQSVTPISFAFIQDVTFSGQFSGNLRINSTEITLRNDVSAGTSTNIAAGDIGSSPTFMGAGCYQAA